MSPAVHWLASYVILSRARSLEGLLLLRLASRAQLSTGAPSYLVAAVDRLLELEGSSSELMRSHLAQLRTVLPADILHLFEDTAVDEEAAAFASATVSAPLPGTLAQDKQPLTHESVVSACVSKATSSRMHARNAPALAEPSVAAPDLLQNVGVAVPVDVGQASGPGKAVISYAPQTPGAPDTGIAVNVAFAQQDRVVGVVRTKQGALTRITSGTRDPRLLRPPFSNNATCYIVHRHVLRASQSYVNALQEAIQRRCRLYVITAIDEVKAADEEKFSLQVRWEALRIANLRRTRFLPGQLPLYVGMPVLLFGKACVHLALMNGCACVVEQIILAEEEPEFEDLSVGVPTQLVFMPAALILRAKDADWILPSALLPPLPNNFDRRGLFLLLPTTEYFPLSLPGKGDLLIRRSQFSVVPASVRIVYNAQGLHVISWRFKLIPAYVYSILDFQDSLPRHRSYICFVWSIRDLRVSEAPKLSPDLYNGFPSPFHVI